MAAHTTPLSIPTGVPEFYRSRYPATQSSRRDLWISVASQYIGWELDVLTEEGSGRPCGVVIVKVSVMVGGVVMTETREE